MPFVRLSKSWASFDRVQRTAVVVWGILLIVTMARAGLQPEKQSVYPIFADAGRHWRAGEELYREGNNPYRYSPGVAAFFAPLTLLPEGPGGVLWRLLGVGLFLLGLQRATRQILPVPPRRLGWLYLLTVPFVAGNVNNGQANLHLVGLFLMACAAVAEERFRLAALALTAATLFKIYPLALGLLLLVEHPRRLGLWLTLALAVGLAIPFAAQSPDYVLEQYRGWLHHLTHSDRQHLIKELWYRDFRLLWSQWVSPMPTPTYQFLALLAALGLAGLTLRRPGPGLILGLGCAWMTVFGPATESSTYILLTPTAIWLILKERSDWTRWPARLGFGMLLTAVLGAAFPWGRSWHTMGVQPLGGLFLLVALLGQVWQKTSCPENSQVASQEPVLGVWGLTGRSRPCKPSQGRPHASGAAAMTSP